MGGRGGSELAALTEEWGRWSAELPVPGGGAGGGTYVWGALEVLPIHMPRGRVGDDHCKLTRYPPFLT